MLEAGLGALVAGVFAAILTDYSYHRLMHVPARRGPLKKLFLYHAAHHRYPTDPKTLHFGYHRRVLGVYVLLIAAACYALVRLAAPGSSAVVACALFAAPVAAYGWAYESLHARVHLGGGSRILGARLFRRIRAHHLEHHTHRPGVDAFRRARGYCLLFPFL